jgi:hypothetical protein
MDAQERCASRFRPAHDAASRDAMRQEGRNPLAHPRRKSGDRPVGDRHPVDDRPVSDCPVDDRRPQEAVTTMLRPSAIAWAKSYLDLSPDQGGLTHRSHFFLFLFASAGASPLDHSFRSGFQGARGNGGSGSPHAQGRACLSQDAFFRDDRRRPPGKDVPAAGLLARGPVNGVLRSQNE